jgi:hypothetical protein
LIDVEVHPVDAFDFQGHMVREDFGDGPWSAQGWLRSSRPLGVNQPRCGSNRGCLQHTPSPARPEPSRLHLVGLRRSLVRIPYGGFSPVRLQMDRPWRPSTAARG